MTKKECFLKNHVETACQYDINHVYLSSVTLSVDFLWHPIYLTRNRNQPLRHSLEKRMKTLIAV